MNEPIGLQQARDAEEWDKVHLLHHRQYDGMEPGFGRLIVLDGRCRACGALIFTPEQMLVRLKDALEAGGYEV